MPPRLMTAASVVPPPMSTTMLRDGVVDRQVGADGRRHGLLDDIDPAGPRTGGGVLERPAFDTGHLAGHADDHARPDEARGPDLVDEVAQHPLGHVGIGDDPVVPGRIAWTCPGVRPSISLAWRPAATSRPVPASMATTEGSSSTTP